MSLNTLASAGNWSLIHRRLMRVAHCLLLLGATCAMAAYGVEQVGFNPAFFADGVGGQQVDITKFSQGNVVLPGNYRTDVYLNG